MAGERNQDKNKVALLRAEAAAAISDPEYRAEVNRVQQDLNGVGLWDLVVDFSEDEFDTIKQAALAAGIDMEAYVKRAVHLAINSRQSKFS